MNIIEVTINAETRRASAGVSLGVLVDEAVEDRRGVAVALDGDVVPRSTWDSTEVADGARIELVAAVQGG